MQNVNIDSYTDILLKTRERLTDPKNWVRGNSYGPNGAKCLGMTMIDYLGNSDYFSFLDDIFPTMKHNVPVWNDSHTHAEVLELLDTAIANRMQVAA